MCCIPAETNDNASLIETLTIVIAILSPFISAFLVYFFAIKGKKKEIGLEKEKELNIVLSNLLLVWNYFARIERMVKVLDEDFSNSIVPKKYFPLFVIKSGFLNDNCFQELDDSIDVLKKYDPLLFFKIEGIGNLHNGFSDKFIMPFLRNKDIDEELLKVGTRTLLRKALDDLEDYLKLVSKKINKEAYKETRSYIKGNSRSNSKDFLNEINTDYYNEMKILFAKNGDVIGTYKEFVEFAKTDEFNKIIEMHFGIFENNNLDDFIEIISNNPDISMEEIQAEINKRNQ